MEIESVTYVCSAIREQNWAIHVYEEKQTYTVIEKNSICYSKTKDHETKNKLVFLIKLLFEFWRSTFFFKVFCLFKLCHSRFKQKNVTIF